MDNIVMYVSYKRTLHFPLELEGNPMDLLPQHSLAWFTHFLVNHRQHLLIIAQMRLPIHELDYVHLLECPLNILLGHRGFFDDILHSEAFVLVQANIVNEPLRPPGQVGFSPQI